MNLEVFCVFYIISVHPCYSTNFFSCSSFTLVVATMFHEFTVVFLYLLNVILSLLIELVFILRDHQPLWNKDGN